jgi:two-component system sensor histidine kinase KdpD
LQGLVIVKDKIEIDSKEIEEFLIAVIRLLAVGIERISLEKENQKTKLLERSNEVREILLNTMSHDLKTPLASILGSVGLLLEKDEFDISTKKHILKNIELSSKRMNRLIGNLLDSARLDDKNRNLKMDWCDMEDILGVALYEFNESEIDKSITTNIDENLELFWGDSVLLNRLIVNLLDNAIKYSIKKEILINIINESENLKIKIFNDGKSIKYDDLKIIFDKFYRLDSYGDIKGSGIGLSICKSIVKAHRGEIQAYNFKNGVCFEVNLPKIKKPMEIKE